MGVRAAAAEVPPLLKTRPLFSSAEARPPAVGPGPTCRGRDPRRSGTGGVTEAGGGAPAQDPAGSRQGCGLRPPRHLGLLHPWEPKPVAPGQDKLPPAAFA